MKQDSRLSFIYTYSRLYVQAVYPPTMDEQPLTVGIFDLATHEMYGIECCHSTR